MKKGILSPLGGRSSCSGRMTTAQMCGAFYAHSKFALQRLLQARSVMTGRTPIEFTQSLQLTFDHQVVYRYPTEKVRTLFKNELNTPHGFRYRKIERLCTINVFGIDVYKLLPARGILRLGGHQTCSADETSLEGHRQALWNDWGWKGKLDELW